MLYPARPLLLSVSVSHSRSLALSCAHADIDRLPSRSIVRMALAEQHVLG